MIHQARSNPQLLDEQIFSERLASAISPIGPNAKCRLQRAMSDVEGQAEHMLVPSSSQFDPKETGLQSDGKRIPDPMATLQAT